MGAPARGPGKHSIAPCRDYIPHLDTEEVEAQVCHLLRLLAARVLRTEPPGGLPLEVEGFKLVRGPTIPFARGSPVVRMERGG